MRPRAVHHPASATYSTASPPYAVKVKVTDADEASVWVEGGLELSTIGVPTVSAGDLDRGSLFERLSQETPKAFWPKAQGWPAQRSLPWVTSRSGDATPTGVVAVFLRRTARVCD